MRAAYIFYDGNLGSFLQKNLNICLESAIFPLDLIKQSAVGENNRGALSA